MKRLLILAGAILAGVLSPAQTISHMWSRGTGGANNDAVQGVDVDAAGNVYSVGYFYGTVDFDPGPGVTNLTSSGSYDIFIQKTDANGNLVWAKRIGGSAGNDVAYAIDVDGSGNIHLTGYFTGTVDFDPGTGVSNLSASSLADTYVCKLDNNGDFIWSISNPAASSTNEQGMGIAVDASGNVYYTGVFRTNMDVDPGPAVNLIYTGAGNQQVFVVKLNAAGTYVWGKGFNGTGTSMGNAIALDPSGNDVYFTGYYSGTVDVDPNAATVNRSAVGQNDIFVEKLSSTGTFGWCNNYGSSYNEAGQGIAVSAAGVTVTGSFASSIDFDLTAGTAILQTDMMSGNTDVFVLRITTAGAYTWVKGIGGTGVDIGYAVSVDQSGFVYTTGSFSGTADLNPTATTQNATSAGAEDIFVMKLDGSGNFVWSGAVGSSGSDAGNAISASSSNNMYYGGHFSGNIDFNPGAAVYTVNNSGMRDLFVSKWNQCTGVPTPPGVISGPITTCNNATPTYSVTAQNGVNYNWTFPAGWAASGNGNSITPTTSSTSGTITVVAQNACGTSSASTLTVSVAPTPTTPGAITGQTSPCPNTGYAYSVTPQAGVSYAWSFPGGWSGSSTTNTVAVIAGSASGNISVVATNICGTSTASTLSVTPLAAPVNPGVISGNDTVCASSSNIYSVSPVAGMNYTWSLPGGWSGTSTTNSITTTAGSSGTIQVTANNSCGTSSPASLAVTVNNAPTVLQNFSVQNPVCENSTQLYSTTSIAGATYNWTLPGGWSGSSTSNSINATAGNNGGNLSVFASNACGTSNTVSITMSVVAIPATPASISGVDSTCANSVESFGCPSVAGATSYTWTLPIGWTGSSASNSITTTVANNGGSIMVTADNMCGSSSAATITVAVDSTPIAPLTIAGDTMLCDNSPFTFTAGSVSNAITYNWTYPSGWSASANNNSLSGVTNNSGGQVTVTASNTCGTSTPIGINVQVNPMPITSMTISGGGMIADQGGATYQWLDCGNNMNQIGGATAQQFVPSVNGNYAVEINLNGCVDTSQCDSFLSSEIAEYYTNSIIMYPNPAKDEVTITSASPIKLITVYDAQGNHVLTVQSSNRINLESLAAGIYTLRITSDENVHYSKLMKE